MTVFRSTGAALFGIILAALAALMPQTASAHAILLGSTPAAGSTVPPGSQTIELHFNSRIDKKRSRISLSSPDKHKTVLAIAPDGQPDILDVTAVLDQPGDYVLHWQVLAVDGHITRGEVPLTVSKSAP
ncbi:copper resistance CopC family protein [Granulibacter bethesdensis]|uniref:copper resistance CopC family protein n=1 Tax=Granulibacter bethesdensis TaxID=364410 RepID=UPI001C12B27A|nr:copper resistance CopC family protein [Granulibacter bethesdensis]